MSLFSRIKDKLLGNSPILNPEPEFDPELFVYIKIPEDVGPIDRGEKYEDPLEKHLAETGVGSVSGGGSQLGEERPDGTRPIAFCIIDVDVTDLEKALVVIRSELEILHAPVGTEIHYTHEGVQLQDELHQSGWLSAQPRTFLHPGFDI